MKKIAFALCLAMCLSIGLVGNAIAQDAEEIVVLEKRDLPWELNTWLVRTVCAQGHVFFISYVLGRTSGAGVHAIQVMEERDGKMLPMRCAATAPTGRSGR
jgi:hypothetical protein